MRAVLLAAVVCLVTLSGCFGQGGKTSSIADPDFIPSTNETAKAPRIQTPTLPPCTLEAGGIAWTDVPPAPKPSTPVMATIKTDAYGVSHIYADDAYSLYFANGYVQARDRLFQLDVLRQVGRGTSAQFLGAGQLASDFEVNRELYTAAEIDAQWQAAPEAGKQVLQAYADGVNRFIAEVVAQDALPGEFVAVGRVPEPWTPQDSVAVIDYLIGFFGVDGGMELSNLQTLARLDATVEDPWAAFEDVVWLRADDTYTTISPKDRTFNGCEDPLPEPGAQAMDAALGAATFGVPGEGRTGVPGVPSGPGSYFQAPDRGVMQGFHWGSNALLLNGSHSATGQPIMWGAPQMGYYKPPVPYQVGLHGAGYDAAGIGVAGAPGIVIGRNNDLAWSATSGIEDQVDLVQLELDGARGYVWDGQTRAMDCWTVEHSVLPTAAGAAGGATDPPMVYDQEVCRAEGWPVVAINEDAGFAWIKKSTTRNEELMGALDWLMLAQATSIGQFREQVADFPFTFNFHVASADAVAYIHTGDVPLRDPALDPRLPTPAGSAHDWRGEAYTAQMDTWATDPSRGYFANWNNAPGYGWRTGDQARLWGPVHRVQQIEYWMQQRLDEKGVLDQQDIEEINWLAATHDSLGLPFMPFLIDAAADMPEVQAELEAWFAAGLPWRDVDGDDRYDDPAHAVWDRMFQEMLDRIQGDELGDLNPVADLDPTTHSDVHAADHGQHRNLLPTVLKALRGTSGHDWCDDVTTPTHESCRDQLVAGLEATVADLQSTYGPDPADWLEPVHMDRFTVIGGTEPDERPMINKGSWLQVVSMADPGAAVSALPPSNTGLITAPELALYIGGVQPEPARLTLELDMYWSGQSKPFPLTPAEVDAQAVSETTLLVL